MRINYPTSILVVEIILKYREANQSGCTLTAQPLGGEVLHALQSLLAQDGALSSQAAVAPLPQVGIVHV